MTLELSYVLLYFLEQFAVYRKIIIICKSSINDYYQYGEIYIDVEKLNDKVFHFRVR